MGVTSKPKSTAAAERIDAFAWDQMPISVTMADPTAHDCPLIYVNQAFEQTTGYSQDEVLGRNCRFLQGPDTDRRAVAALRAAIETGTGAEVTLLNYRKDGQTFWNELHLSPLKDAKGRVIYVVGIQKPVVSPDMRTGRHIATDLKLQEIQHRVKNHLAMIVSLIRLHSHGAPDIQAQRFHALSQRVESLQALYEQLTEKSSRRAIDDNDIDLAAYLSRIVETTIALDPRPGIRARIDAAPLRVSVQLATHLGMLVSELATNALQHGLKERDGGEIEMRLAQQEDGSIILRVADDGAGMDADTSWPSPRSLGGRIVKSMCQSLGAEIRVDKGMGTGAAFEIDLPAEAVLDET